MKVGDLVKCDDWVFDGTTGIIIKLLYSHSSKAQRQLTAINGKPKGWPPSAIQIFTPKGTRRVSIHNAKVINEVI
jgi:hypothetical protein